MNLGSYQVLAQIGEGGMGAVFEVLSPEGEHLAAKVLRFSRREDSAPRFDRERRALATLGEELGLVPLLDFGSSEQGPFIVMPLLVGGTLADRLRGGPLAVDETLELGLALAGALAQSHAAGLVHRDLKPANILFDGDGRPLVADLGLAKHFNSDASGASQSVCLSRSGEMRGTIGYMPPEQLRDAKSVGPRADVFALGAIFYECLVGAPAFQGETPLEVLSKLERGDHVPLREARPDVPVWLARVIERTLAADPRERYADGAALRLGLSGVEERKSKLPPVAALLLLLSLGGGLAFAFGSESGASSAAGEVELSPVGSETLALPAPDPSRLRWHWTSGQVLACSYQAEGHFPSRNNADTFKRLELQMRVEAVQPDRVILRATLSGYVDRLSYGDGSGRSWGQGYDSRRPHAPHPFDRVLGGSFAFDLHPETGEVLEVRGVEAIQALVSAAARDRPEQYRIYELTRAGYMQESLARIFHLFPAGGGASSGTWDLQAELGPSYPPLLGLPPPVLLSRRFVARREEARRSRLSWTGELTVAEHRYRFEGSASLSGGRVESVRLEERFNNPSDVRRLVFTSEFEW